jgi:hypothetical protein
VSSRKLLCQRWFGWIVRCSESSSYVEVIAVCSLECQVKGGRPAVGSESDCLHMHINEVPYK